MPRKRVQKKFDVVAAVKSAAREAIGAPPATRKVDAVAKKKRKSQKHKATLGKLLSEE